MFLGMFSDNLFCKFCSFCLKTMAKEVVAQIKLQIPAAQANPGPPVETALGPRAVNIMAFAFVIPSEVEESLNLE